MRIGVIGNTKPANGGTHYYVLSALDALRDYGVTHKYVLFYEDDSFPAVQYELPNWEICRISNSGERLDNKIAKALAIAGITGPSRLASGRYKALLDYSLDLVFCPSTNLYAWYCDIPFVITIHDVYHRQEYKLPGRTFFNSFLRDIIWRKVAHSARVVFVDSELGKKDVISAYQISDKKIHILPNGPADFIWQYDKDRWKEVRAQYNLPECYVFCPGIAAVAKNQKRVIEAIALLQRQNHLDIHAVFAGPFGDYGKVLINLSRKEGIQHLIHFLGQVPDENMALLYKGALCLTMASYIGPTNMPVWEAFAIGCAVVSSNIGAMPDQVGDAGLLFDPDNAQQLAESILRIYKDGNLRSIIVQRGMQRVQAVRPENRAKVLLQGLEKAMEKVRK